MLDKRDLVNYILLTTELKAVSASVNIAVFLCLFTPKICTSDYDGMIEGNILNTLSRLSTVVESRRPHFGDSTKLKEVIMNLPTLTVANGIIKVSSLQVAAHFNKKHYNVLRDIKELETSDSFMKLNFEVCYEISTLQNNKPSPYYLMTRDGFMMLAMSYTGKEATQIKEAYIAAFNQMESELTVSRQQLTAITKELLNAKPDWRTIMKCRHAGLNNTQIGKLLDCSKDTIRDRIKRMETCGISLAQSQLQLTLGE